MKKLVWILFIVLIFVGLFLSLSSCSHDKKLDAVDVTNDLVLLQSAVRQNDGSILLVPAENWKTGMAAYLPALMPNFKVSFDYKIVGSGVGADGIVFAFYASTNDVEESGFGLNFNGSNGYGIEFDTFGNSGDPEYDHIALIHKTTDNHLANAEYGNLSDSIWHKADIEVNGDHLVVKVDNQVYIDTVQQFEKNNSYMYIAATTGAYYNEHYIRNFVITGSIDNSQKKLEVSK